MDVSTAAGTWTFDPQVIAALVVLGTLYWRGMRGSFIAVVAGRRTVLRRWQAAAFFAGLAVVFLALESPIDAYDDQLFWAHMVQHVLLIMVAAPLLALGDPAMPLLRGIPLGMRRATLRPAMRQRRLHTLGRALSWLTRPAPVFIIFSVDLYLWHWSWLFNLTLQNQAVHDLEHLCFLGTALLFWGQVIDLRPLHTRLSYVQRAVYTAFTAAASNLLAMYLVFAPRPLYAAYAAVGHRPGGISAVADQQFAGAIMWVPVLFLFGGAFLVCVFKWLGEEEETSGVPAGSYQVLPSRHDGTRGPRA